MVDVGASMQCLYNNFNFIRVSDRLDFTNVNRVSINHFSLFGLFFSNPDKNSLLLKWINGLNNTLISSCAVSNVCVWPF